VRIRQPSFAAPDDHDSRLGSSDVAAILGIDPFKSALDVWAAKTGLVKGSVSSPQMLRGIESEESILVGWARRRDVPLRRVVRCGTLRSSAEPWRGATLDALVTSKRTRRAAIAPALVLEAKLVGFGSMHQWGPEDGPAEDSVPPHVQVQTQWQARHVVECLNQHVEGIEVVAAIGTDLRLYRLDYDPAWAEELVEVTRAWWHTHVVGGLMPMVEGRRELLARLHPKPTMPLEDADERVIGLVREYDDCRELVKRAEWARDTVADELCATIGERAGFSGPWGSATWKEQPRTTTDWKLLTTELGVTPEQIAEYQNTTTSRVLRVNLKGTDR